MIQQYKHIYVLKFANFMMGHARVKELALNVLFTLGLAHRLNLVLPLIFTIPPYILMKTNSLIFSNRWSSRTKILHTVVTEWSGNSPKSSSEPICVVKNHLKNLKKFKTFEITFLALIFKFCLKKISITCSFKNKKSNDGFFFLMLYMPFRPFAHFNQTSPYIPVYCILQSLCLVSI
ncbi:zinc finger MYM-type protein 1-like [Aphis craccivora]|uniref:Zinc finger MYM-type protein 1-like n=1 Tax=Aphis craccivora TaxID=307492 RepID=A0A6G0Z624_APHCR|nr:zinc finger MYM-type protein 1-like [Aphis craccivora]